MKTASFLTFSLLILGFQQAHASPVAEQKQGISIGMPYFSMGLMPPPGSDPAASLNLHFSQPLGTFTNFFSNFSFPSHTDSSVAEVTKPAITSFQSGVEWFFAQPQKMQWFMMGGMGGVHTDLDNRSDSIQPVISFGIGQNWSINPNDSLRWELRTNQAFGKDEPPSWTPVNFQAIFSYQWGN